jgi:hypothetical protein
MFILADNFLVGMLGTYIQSQKIDSGWRSQAVTSDNSLYGHIRQKESQYKAD